MDERAFYRSYLARCNEHRFDELADFVAPDVVVDDQECGLNAYAASLHELGRAFPDYHWQLRHLLVDGDLLAAHLRDTGTHGGPWLGVAATGRTVAIAEYAVYRLRDGRIAEVWSTADDLSALDQIRRA
jgi:predicted ester cyclase